MFAQDILRRLSLHMPREKAFSASCGMRTKSRHVVVGFLFAFRMHATVLKY